MKGLRFLIMTGLMLAIFAMVGPLAVGQFVDLEVLDVSVWPSQEQGVYGGMVPTFYANVTNNGTETATDVEIHTYWEGGGQQDEFDTSPETVPEFHPGMTLQFSTPWPIRSISESEGSQLFTLNCSADYTTDIEQEDNELEIQVDVQPDAPDIVVELATDYPIFTWYIDDTRVDNGSVVTDTYVWVSATIYNLGTAPAIGVTVYFSFDGKAIGSDVRSSSSDVPVKASVKWKTPDYEVEDGQLHVYVIMDRDISPGDNDAYFDVDVEEPISSDKTDFEIIEILKPETGDDIYSYAAIEVKVSVGNIGYRSTDVDPVAVEFWAGEVSSMTLQETKYLHLAAQETPVTNVHNLKFIWRVEVDADVRAEIEIIVDPDGEYDEVDEGNNDESRSWMVEVARPEDHPQLKLQSVSFIAPDGSYMDDTDLEVYPNFPITFFMNIRNYGVMPVMDVPVWIWWSTEEGDWNTSNATYIGSPEIKYQAGKDGAPYSSKPLTFTWNTDPTIGTGDYWFIIFIDPDNDTAHFNETDENGDPNRDDNLLSYEFHFEDQDLSDLTFGDIELWYIDLDPEEELPDNNSAYYGGKGYGRIEIRIEIKNLGDVAEQFVVQIDDIYFDKDLYDNPPGSEDGSRVIKSDQQSISSYDTEVVVFIWEEWKRVGEAGTHTFNMSITAENFESNSKNNFMAFDVPVINLGLPDLIVVEDGDSPYEVAPDYITNDTMPATIIVPIKNIGPRSTKGEFEFTLAWENKAGTIGGPVVDSQGRDHWTIDVLLGENEQTTKTIEWEWFNNLSGSGKYYIVCTIDTDDDIREEVEDNNEASFKWTIQVDRADIEVTEDDIDIGQNAWNITKDDVSTSYLIMGRGANIDVTVNNIGTAEITQTITVEAIFERQRDGLRTDPITVDIIGGLDAEDSDTVTLTWTPLVSDAEYTTELWTMYVKVPDNLEDNPFVELDRGNQAPQLDITVIQSLADPAIEDDDIKIVVDDKMTDIYYNVPVPINASITNVGPEDVVGVLVSIEAGTSLDNETTVDIDSGETVLFQWIWTPKKVGTTSVTVRLRMPADTDEIDDTNNIARDTDVPVHKVPSPELAISESTVALNPGTPKSGEEVDIIVIVNNNGGTSATSVQVQVLIDGDEVATGIIDNIASTGYETIEFTWKAGKIGNHTITVIVDPAGLIEDPVPQNNEATFDFEVDKKPPSSGGDDTDPTIYIIAAVAIGIGSAGAILFLMRKKA